MTPDIIKNTLMKYFVFEKIFNLLDYGVSLDGLKEDLLPLCKESYENNYRFVFLHYDTDYHITNDQPGLIMRNLQKIICSLDISNFFVLVVSQKNLQPHLDLLREQETTDDCSMACLQHPLQENMHFSKIDTSCNPDRIVYKFMSLNRMRRFHRTLLYALMKYEKLLEQGAVSYCDRKQRFYTDKK